MSSVRKPRYHISPEEYLAIDRAAEERSEYEDGEMLLITGASRRHNLIATNITTELGIQLRDRRCEIYAADMRVRVPLTSKYVYPDVVAVCGDPEFEDEDLDVLLNPSLVVEVLSPSTERRDRETKLDYYRRIPSVTDYLIVAQEVRRAVLHTRQPDSKWLLSEAFKRGDVLTLSSIGCELSFADIYRKVGM